MNFSESALALRIRWALVGARRMNVVSRVFTAVVLCGVFSVSLPSTGVANQNDGVDWETVKTTPPEEWSEELKAQIVAAGHNLDAIIKRMRLAQEKAVWREAMAVPPEQWSNQLKAKLLTLKPGSTIKEIADGIRRRQQAGSEKTSDINKIGRKLREAVARGELTPEEARKKMEAIRQNAKGVETTDLNEQGRKLREAVARGELTPEEARKKMEDVRGRLAGSQKGDDRLSEFKRGVVARAMATSPKEWSEELKRAIVRAGWDLNKFTEGIRIRQAKIDAGENRVGKVALNSARPNPFNPEVTIEYDVYESTDVQIVIYNLTGQKVRTLLSKQITQGPHQLVWDGRNDSGQKVASGAYLVDMRAEGLKETLKIMLTK